MAKKQVTAADAKADGYYDTMRQAKRDAGLPLETALEVTARQRKEDIANGVTLDLGEEDAPEPEKKPGEKK